MIEGGESGRNPTPSPGAMMAKARAASHASPNRVRQVGAVLLTHDGAEIAACNAFPGSVRVLDERCEGEARFVWMEHAERRAIFAAARQGIATQGGHLTTTFFPCIDCARAIVDCGIACLDTPAPAFSDPVWGGAFARSQSILEEGDVKVRIVEEKAPQP